MASRVAVVGAGISGAACAGELRSAGLDVEVFERGRYAGGRMASPTIGPRRVDFGAAYFTVSDSEFRAQVETWRGDGLARPWTDTFEVVTPDERSSRTGPVRWAAPDGLRSLVRALEPDEQSGNEITGLDELDLAGRDAVVLAMPDPQAALLAPDLLDWVDYDPVITVAFAWEQRCWDFEAAAFVNDDPDITFVADDGSRRGDGAAVLVVNTTPDLAREHMDDPDEAISPVFDTLRRLFGVADPARTHAHRWKFAQPTGTHGDEPFALVERGGRPLGVCGDSWCPSGSPRVEAAWLSGHRLGRQLAERLGD